LDSTKLPLFSGAAPQAEAMAKFLAREEWQDDPQELTNPIVQVANVQTVEDNIEETEDLTLFIGKVTKAEDQNQDAPKAPLKENEQWTSETQDQGDRSTNKDQPSLTTVFHAKSVTLRLFHDR
jgi:hypothetical protein